MQFRHEIKIHTVHRRNKRRWKEDNIDDCEYLNNLVLLDINQTEEGILEVVQTVKTKSRVVKK